MNCNLYDVITRELYVVTDLFGHVKQFIKLSFMVGSDGEVGLIYYIACGEPRDVKVDY